VRLGFLVSGRGSNLAAVLEAVAGGALPNVEPVLVISNRPGVPALEVAASHAVPALVLHRAGFPDATACDAAIGDALTEVGVDLALLAGYDRLLRRSFFERFTGRAMNVHPSLLPRHGGKGMIGLAVHRAVLETGDTETGVTVHEVTPELDAGPALAQVRVPVIPGESAEVMADRVLGYEHRLVVEVLRRLSAVPSGAWASVSMTAALAPSTGGDATHERRRTHA
jgi:phosphoribosylglycinamide formyltransferase-1